MGLGMAAVFKHIPDYYPGSVGVVGGIVGVLGGLGGFFLPILFGSLLKWSGIWTTCWLLLAAVTEVNLDRHSESKVRDFEKAVEASPQIVRCVSATGPADYILTVLVPDIKHYEKFLHTTLFEQAGVTHVRSAIVRWISRED